MFELIFNIGKTALIIINANIGSNPIRSLMSLDQTLNDTKVTMAEWSKAADSSSAIFGCAGSNPAGDTIAPMAQWLRRPTVNR